MISNSYTCGRVLPAVCFAVLAACTSGDEPTRLATRSATVSGHIKLEDEASAADVAVQLEGAQTYTTQTDGNGRFTLEHVAAGHYQFKASTPSFAEFQDSIDVYASALDLGEKRLAALRAAVDGEALVEGVGDDGKTIKRRGGVSVTVTKVASPRAPTEPTEPAKPVSPPAAPPHGTTSNDQGRWVIPEVPAGVYDVILTYPGAASGAVRRLRIEGSTPVTVPTVILHQVTGFFAVEGTLGDGTRSARYTNTPSVGVRLSGFYAKSVKIGQSSTGEAAGCAYGPVQTYLALAQVELAQAGENTLCVVYVGDDGNETSPLLERIVFDPFAPTLDSLLVNGGAATVTSLTGEVLLSMAGADTTTTLATMKVANTGGASCDAALAAAAPADFHSPVAWALAAPGPGVEGPRYVCAALADAAGNWSLPVSAAVVYDTRAPQLPAHAVVIDGGAAYARSPQVQLALAATGATQVLIGNDGSFAGAQWEPLRAFTAWYLPNADGAHTVTVRFRDAAGNESLPAAAQIILDTQAPAAPAVAIDAGAPYANTTAVTLTLTATGATRMRIANGAAAAVSFGYAPTAAWSLTPGDGVKSVTVNYADDAGNESAAATAFIILDTKYPAGATFSIDGGAAFARNPAGVVSLGLAAGGAFEMNLSEMGCGAGGWQEFRPQVTFPLVLTQGRHTVHALFRDEAGNRTPCLAQSIVLDTVLDAPGLRVWLVGAERVSGRTRNPLVALRAATAAAESLGADAVEMQIANDAGFAASNWVPAVTQTTWQVQPGDGAKTVYARFRDAAGNTSAVLEAAIHLDQTPPEAPGLGLADLDGDGYALSETAVEMRIVRPSDPYLRGYELQRYVQGVDLRFETQPTTGFMPAGPVTQAAGYADAVTATSGYVHTYRVRAYDDLGNTSAWSVEASAQPYEAVRRLTWVKDAAGLRYFLAANRGTFASRTTYRYQDVNGAPAEEALGDNRREWVREGGRMRFEETLVVRTQNADGSLLFESEVPLLRNRRETLDPAAELSAFVGDRPALALDAAGALHVAYYDCGPRNTFGECTRAQLKYATNRTGTWAYQVVDASGNAGMFSAIAVDAAGHAHVTYQDTANFALKYATNASGTWVTSDLSYAGYYSAVAAGPDGIVHAVRDGDSFFEPFDLLYATRTSGAWTEQELTSGSTDEQWLSLAVDADGKAHVSYYNCAFDFDYNCTRGDLVYATNAGGTWSYRTIDSAGLVGMYTSIAVDRGGRAHIAYYDCGAVDGSGACTVGDLKYADNVTGTWSKRVLDAAGNVGIGASLALDPDGHVFVCYGDRSALTNDLKLATNASGAWAVSLVDPLGDYGGGCSMGADRLHLYMAYGDYNYYRRGLHLAALDNPATGAATIVSTDDAGFTSAVAVDARLFEHVTYYDQTHGRLLYATNRAGAWAVSVVDASPGTGWASALALDPQGFAHTTYADVTARNLMYATNRTGAWVTERVDAALNTGGFSSLARDAAGRVHVAYTDLTGHRLLYGVRQPAGGWSNASVDARTVGSYASLATDASGNVHIAYTIDDGACLAYAVGSAGSFSTACVDPTGATAPALRLDAQGNPVVAYVDAAHKQLKLTRRVGGLWQTSVLDDLANDSYTAALGIDAAGTYHIVYYDGFKADLRYASNPGGTWVFGSLDDAGAVGQFPSLALDPAGNLHVSYYDRLPGDLKLFVYPTAGLSGVATASRVRRTAEY